jgi:hypothetical protein
MEAWYQELVNVLMKKQDLPAVHEIFQGKKSSTQKILSTIAAFKQKHQNLKKSDALVLDSHVTFAKIWQIVCRNQDFGSSLDHVNFKEIGDMLSEFDSFRFACPYLAMLHLLFRMTVKKGWLNTARIFHGCLKSCHQSVKNGEKLFDNRTNLTASYLFVEEFEMDHQKLVYLKKLLEQENAIGNDQKSAKLLKRLKDYQESDDLPTDVKDFAQAEAIARKVIKIQDQLEDRFGKYFETVEQVKTYVPYLIFNVLVFVPNTKALIRAQVYFALSSHSSDFRMNIKLLEKSIDYRREFRSLQRNVAC